VVFVRVFGLEKRWRMAAEGGVVSFSVLEEFDEVKQIGSGLFAGGEDVAVD
jgi:hypothetical protein